MSFLGTDFSGPAFDKAIQVRRLETEVRVGFRVHELRLNVCPTGLVNIYTQAGLPKYSMVPVVCLLVLENVQQHRYGWFGGTDGGSW